jgi:FkbM family methyltransferase
MNVKRNNLTFNVTEGTPNGPFWGNSGWESEIYKIFDEHLVKDRSYLDIGAWIGPTVLYGSQLAKKVHCFEPDPVAQEELFKNIALNGFTNIIVNQFALSDYKGKMTLGSDNRLGESVTRVGNFRPELSFETECMTLDDYVSSIIEEAGNINFVKIDIEGGEYAVAKSIFLRNEIPPTLLSIHPPMMPNFQENIEHLIELRSHYLRGLIVSGPSTGSEVTDDYMRKTQDYYTILLT